MPRDGNGVYSKPSGTTATAGTTIESAKYNTLMDDFVTDMNAARPIAVGGTGASTASAARTALGVEIGANVQAYDAGLASIAGLTTAADKMIYTTASDTYAVAGLTSFARTLLDDTDAATARATLGAQASDADLSDLATNGFATAANYRAAAADKTLKADKVWDAMAEVSLSDGANISLDMDTGIDFTVTLAGNRTLDNPTNVTVGKKGRIRVVQDGTGSRTLDFGTYYKFAGGTAPTLTTTASAEDYLYYDCVSATKIIISAQLDVK